MIRRLAILSACAGLVLAAMARREVPFGVPLGDDALRSANGRDSATGGIMADCASTSLGPNQVVWANCPGWPGNQRPPMPETECIRCVDPDGSFIAGTPPEFGFGGYMPTGLKRNCNDLWRQAGVCGQDGTCNQWHAVQFCSGNPPTYQSQSKIP